MNWTSYVVRGLIFVVVYTIIMTFVFSNPLARSAISGVIAGFVYMVIGHYVGLFRKKDAT